MGRAGRAPLLVGGIAFLSLAAMLAVVDPGPGRLSGPHAGLEEDGLSGCRACHADGGLAAGCLGCHDGIATQLDAGRGYHHFLLGDGERRCAGCHPEHHGKEFDVMEAVSWGSEDFDHGHVAFTLEGKHDSLDCTGCHKQEEHRTYLGLRQDCVSCHGDAHEQARFLDCERCHGQESFESTARFDHAAHFVLDGGHSDVACKACHQDSRAHVEQVRGQACTDCHTDPHRTRWEVACERCHRRDEAAWAAGRSAVTAGLHARTGFRLGSPHDEVVCEACHTGERTLPGRKEEECQACHEDPHDGQFRGKHSGCLDCHERTRFDPARFGRKEHAIFRLRDAHARAECQSCHRKDERTGVRRFAGTPATCRSCHDDVHKGQFNARSCRECHDERRFQPARYDVRDHRRFPLTGSHEGVSCRACHKPETRGDPLRFVGVAHACKSCHLDPHRGQFARELKRGDCTACHRKDARTFEIRKFDHARRAGYALRGAHAGAACGDCHRKGRYRGLAADCASCHTDVHRGQLRRAGVTRCDRCHTSFEAWATDRFDHDRLTRFRLDALHRQVACTGCHPTVVQPDGTPVTQFKPIGTTCRSCHDFGPR